MKSHILKCIGYVLLLVLTTPGHADFRFQVDSQADAQSNAKAKDMDEAPQSLSALSATTQAAQNSNWRVSRNTDASLKRAPDAQNTIIFERTEAEPTPASTADFEPSAFEFGVEETVLEDVGSVGDATIVASIELSQPKSAQSLTAEIYQSQYQLRNIGAMVSVGAGTFLEVSVPESVSINRSELTVLVLENGAPWALIVNSPQRFTSRSELLLDAAVPLLEHYGEGHTSQYAAALYERNIQQMAAVEFADPLLILAASEFAALGIPRSEAQILLRSFDQQGDVRSVVDVAGSQTTQEPSVPSQTDWESAPATPTRAAAQGVSTYQSGLQAFNSGCSGFEIRVGLLKANLARLLEECGYSIGQWAIGDQEYEYDFEIRKSYRLNVSGLPELLEAIEHTYLIQGTRNTLDKTVDFEPSRGAVLEGLEIQDW